MMSASAMGRAGGGGGRPAIREQRTLCRIHRMIVEASLLQTEPTKRANNNELIKFLDDLLKRLCEKIKYSFTENPLNLAIFFL
ncbi:hypothetical protein [Raoultella terrigena]|uniref:hypothetical protein n=1 Tax=Raoultella terrigena TaxID=577 RepID=UPI00384FC3E5